MPKVGFKDWLFEADVDRTREVFEKTSHGGSEDCICDLCKNYRAQKDNVFPSEVRDFFESVGINYRKECETWTTHKLENGNIHYSGWFHFAGTMLKGLSSKRNISDNGYSLELEKVNENFEIGFIDERSLTFFDERDQLVQVEFATGLPWVIDIPEPEEV